ncbi:Glucosidase YgjK precursor [Thiorhodovibrio winogradskyi]|uniref:Glucosidase YgjK n=1 Tax=Thiorhodovibrio winogradskyi TaxID=77007 RepID=A0ABZ0SDS5_9GAMM|nr:trehalase family glycosidase [Thiorhodovibrio winogradskyi]
MAISQHNIARLRARLAAWRTPTRAVARYGGRGWRALHYGLNLLLFSRILAGRAGFAPIELPPAVLRKKGVTRAPPRLRILEAGEQDALAGFAAGFAEVYALLFANLQGAGLLSPHRFALPGPAFQGIYLWDSAFIAPIWRAWSPEIAEEVLLSVLAVRDGDRLQHVVSEFAQSRYTQPPLLAWSALHLARARPPAQARAWLARVYPPLVAYQHWLEAHRRLPNGLYAWVHPYESGVENSPRFSSADERRCRDTRTLAAPDFSAYVVLQLDALREMAQRLDQPEAAARHAEQAASLRARINARLWDARDGLYYDHDAAGQPLRVATIASLLPLWAGIPDTARAMRLIARIMAPAHFATPMPLPSVDRGDPRFEKDMWRGPVWLNTAYGVIQGLLRHGQARAAGELALRLCAGVYGVFANEQRLYEFYDPDVPHTRALRRKRGNWWKTLTLGAGPQRDFVGWSGLVNPLFIEVLLGLEEGDGALRLCPRLPARTLGLRLELELPRLGGTLTLAVPAPDCFEGHWRDARGEQAFRTGFNQPVSLCPGPPTGGVHPCAIAI